MTSPLTFSLPYEPQRRAHSTVGGRTGAGAAGGAAGGAFAEAATMLALADVVPEDLPVVGAESLGRVGAGAGVHPHEMVATAIKENTSFDRADARMKCFLPQILVDAHGQYANLAGKR